MSIDGRRYVDGGVVENLGVTGLTQYVAATRRAPDVVIISDLGAEPEPPHRSYKPSIFQMAVQAPDLTSRALHQILYRAYSNGAYDRTAGTLPAQPYRPERAALWPGSEAGSVAVFILAPTAPAERGRFAPDIEQDRVAMVATLNTLQELEPGQVDAAFWAGAALARAYVGAIRTALGQPPAPLPPLPVPGCAR